MIPNWFESFTCQPEPTFGKSGTSWNLIKVAACISCSCAQNDGRNTGGWVAALLDVGADWRQAQLCRAGNVGTAFVDRHRPLLGEALDFELGLELVSIELGGWAARFDPQVEL